MAFKYLFAAVAVLCTIQATAGQSDVSVALNGTLKGLTTSVDAAISIANGQIGHGGGSTDGIWGAAVNVLGQLKTSIEMAGTMIQSSIVTNVDSLKMEADQNIFGIKSQIQSQVSQVSAYVDSFMHNTVGKSPATVSCIMNQKAALDSLSASSIAAAEGCVNGKIQQLNSLPAQASGMLGVAQSVVNSAVNECANCVNHPSPPSCLNNFIMSLSSSASMVPMQISAQLGDIAMMLSNLRTDISQCSSSIVGYVASGANSIQSKISTC